MIVGDLIVTNHALKRWAERGEPLPLEDALRSALPFGKRTATHMMLRCGAAVFHVTLDDGKRIVTTVLTDAMADCNAQVFHGGRQNSVYVSASRNSRRVRRHHSKVRYRLRKQQLDEEE